jgi:hypothetical protein
MGATPVRARTPEEIALVRNTVLLLALAAAGALVWLFWGWRNRGLLWIGGAAAVAFLMQAFVRRIWRGARTAAQMVGSAGLTSTAAAAYYVVTGQLDSIAWSLWAANLLFALNQIHFVQLRIHAVRAESRAEKLAVGRAFLAGQLLLVAIIVSACVTGAFRPFAAAAFLPLVVRGFAWFAAKPKPLAIHALGKRELLYACVFGVLLVAGMRLR